MDIVTRVELRDDAALSEPLIVICNVDGSGMRRPAEVAEAIGAFQRAQYGQPWKTTPNLDQDS